METDMALVGSGVGHEEAARSFAEYTGGRELSRIVYPADQIHETPQKTTDIPGSFDGMNILLTKHPDVKYWLVAGMNDTATLGAVRALEGIGFTQDNSIGIGIKN